MRRFITILLAMILAVSFSYAEEITGRTLTRDLLNAFCEDSEAAREKIAGDLLALNDPLMDAVAGHWLEVFLDPDYTLHDAETEDPSVLDIPDPSAHAFVVLGYRLKDGAMEPELARRCDAAAAAAKAWPESILICTGGETGLNNPYHHTEAGLMRDYLTEECGISASRIFTDIKARTTTENVINTFRILREEGIRSITVVTSTYHQRWATVLFYAAAEQNRLAYDDPVSIEVIGNWCCNVNIPPGYNDTNADIAASQLISLLNR